MHKVPVWPQTDFHPIKKTLFTDSDVDYRNNYDFFSKTYRRSGLMVIKTPKTNAVHKDEKIDTFPRVIDKRMEEGWKKKTHTTRTKFEYKHRKGKKKTYYKLHNLMT